MDPVHLEEDEVTYELTIRKLESVGILRHLTASLRKALTEEMRGLKDEPKTSIEFYDQERELEICEGKIVELAKIKKM